MLGEKTQRPLPTGTTKTRPQVGPYPEPTPSSHPTQCSNTAHVSKRSIRPNVPICE
jgi:hypothetical protein